MNVTVKIMWLFYKKSTKYFCIDFGVTNVFLWDSPIHAYMYIWLDKGKSYWVNKVKSEKKCLLNVVTEACVRVHSGHSSHHTCRRAVFRHIQPVPRAGELWRLVCVQNRDAHHCTVFKRTSSEEPRVHVWVLHLHSERVSASPLVVHGLVFKIKNTSSWNITLLKLTYTSIHFTVFWQQEGALKYLFISVRCWNSHVHAFFISAPQ